MNIADQALAAAIAEEPKPPQKRPKPVPDPLEEKAETPEDLPDDKGLEFDPNAYFIDNYQQYKGNSRDPTDLDPRIDWQKTFLNVREYMLKSKSKVDLFSDAPAPAYFAAEYPEQREKDGVGAYAKGKSLPWIIQERVFGKSKFKAVRPSESLTWRMVRRGIYQGGGNPIKVVLERIYKEGPRAK